MKLEQVALITYTIRDAIKTPKEIAESMAKLRQIGFKAVQISAMGPIDELELHKILDGEGLVCCATHEDSTRLLNEPEAIAERLHKLDCKFTAYPHPSNVKLDTAEDIRVLAARLVHAGEVLRQAGVTLTYHNHNLEFRHYDDNGHTRTMLEMLYAHTSVSNLQGEIDTYWVQSGGGDPVAWCEWLRGRLPLLHLKDYVINEKFQPTFAEIGYGNLDWKRILPAAEKSGCQWFIIEQDVCPGDPFDSLRKSFEYLRENHVQG